MHTGRWLVPPPRLERGLLPPEGSALSTELWGRCLRVFPPDGIFYHDWPQVQGVDLEYADGTRRMRTGADWEIILVPMLRSENLLGRVSGPPSVKSTPPTCVGLFVRIGYHSPRIQKNWRRPGFVLSAARSFSFRAHRANAAGRSPHRGSSGLWSAGTAAFGAGFSGPGEPTVWNGHEPDNAVPLQADRVRA